MKIIIKNTNDGVERYEIQNIPDEDLAKITASLTINNTATIFNEVISSFTITDEEIGSIEKGATFTYDGTILDINELEIVDVITEESNSSEIKELKTKSTAEVIASPDNYYHLGVTPKKKGDLLIDIMLGGNNNEEKYLMRKIMAIVLRTVYEATPPTVEEDALIEYVKALGVDADLILNKFNDPNI